MTSRALCLSLLALLAAPVFAQPSPQPSDDELEAWAKDLDRPLARALAYERRDVVREMLERPSSLAAADARVLAREVGIPLAHAETLVEAARQGKLGNASLIELLRFKAGPVSLTGAQLVKGTQAELRAAGMTEARAQELIRFRDSARRANLHFREVRAITEARARGAEAVRESVRASGEVSGRVKNIAKALGLRAEPANLAEAKAEAARLRAEVAGLRTAATDTLGPFRRADGTIDWNRFGKSELARGAGGMAHFAFALFLKELAVVLRTGDEARLGEFVDGLMTTDFFVNYGLFAAGARAADVAYGRYVRRLARKKFVNGVIRSNLVLAAGLAVPQAVRGQFELDTYLVDVAALGLSATAVKAGVEGVKGVWRLVRAGRGAVNLGRLGSPVGWVYTAGETAVVLILGDHLANRFDAYLTKRELRGKIEQAESALNDMLGRLERGEGVLPERIQEALDQVERAYDDLRRLEMMPLDARVRAFRREINGASGQMLEAETSLRALEERFADNPNLRRNLEERFGSTEAYLERLREARSGEAEARIRSEAERFERDFPRDLERAYRGDVEPDQPPARDSRLDLYDQETTYILKALDATTDPEARRHLVLALERVRLGRAMDASVLAAGSAPAQPATRAPGPEEAFVGAADRVRGE